MKPAFEEAYKIGLPTSFLSKKYGGGASNVDLLIAAGYDVLADVGRAGRGAYEMLRLWTPTIEVNGHLHLPALRAALERHVAAETVGVHCHSQDVSAARCSLGPPPKLHGTRDILPSSSHPVSARAGRTD